MFEGYVTGSNLQRPGFALRLNYFGDPDTVFLTAPLRSQAPDTWVSHSVYSDLFLQSADGRPIPFASISDIPQDTPVTGIHFRDVAFLGSPYLGFGDLVTLRFGTDASTYNFEAAAVPEPASLLLLGTGLLGTRIARRRGRRTY